MAGICWEMTEWRVARIVVAAAMAATISAVAWRWIQKHSYRRTFERTTKAARREQQRETRRRQKDKQLQRKKVERATELKEQEGCMTDEQKREKMERIKMQRVEQYQKLDDGFANGLRTVVDLAFAHKQTDRECHSIFKQLGCVYGYMKRCTLDRVVSLHVASYYGRAADIGHRHGLPSWKIHLHDCPIDRGYQADEIVYLSPDASDVLHDIDPSVVYVVGGIVDRSVRRGQSLEKARGHNFRVMRLPLQEHMDVRKLVLNIDAVLIALIEFSNHRDWVRAFEVAIPKRMANRRDS